MRGLVHGDSHSLIHCAPCNPAKHLEVWDVTPRGTPYRTSRVVYLVREWGIRLADLREAITWDGGPVGIAEMHYPHPQGWKLAHSTNKSTLENMTVRILSAVLRIPHESEPSCVVNWPKAVGPVDMYLVIRRITSPLLSTHPTRLQILLQSVEQVYAYTQHSTCS